MKSSLLLHYDNLACFKKTYFRGVISREHQVSGEKFYTKVLDIDTNIMQEPAGGLRGYVFEKEGVNYFINLYPHKPREVLPIKILGDVIDVSIKNDVYKLVLKWASVRFKEERRMSFRDLINTLTLTKHSNPYHQKLMMIMACMQYIARANFRVCSPPGFGKDSTVKTLSSLMTGCVAVGSPTLAKLEYRANSQWLVINEMMDLNPSQWRVIEQFLLAAGDFSPTLEKHSLGRHNNVDDTFDISNLSLSLFYNDVTEYADSEFFDDRAKGSVKDRFLPLRVFGRYEEDWWVSKTLNNERFVNDHLEDYKDLVYTLAYYKRYYHDEVKDYDSSILFSLVPELSMKTRWRDSITVLLKGVGLYVNNQAEYDEWMAIISSCIRDYHDMLRFVKLSKDYERRLGKVRWGKRLEELNELPTFSARVKELEQ